MAVPSGLTRLSVPTAGAWIRLKRVQVTVKNCPGSVAHWKDVPPEGGEGTAAADTAAEGSGFAPLEPWNVASPKLKIPPSPATSQYPFPLGVARMLMIG